jgi:TolA-binding protein
LIIREAFYIYRKGNYDDAIDKLLSIKEDAFNYPSALLLKAFSYEGKGNKEEARKLYSRIKEVYGNTYFARVATAMLLALKDN